jgi:hypothetical protein
MVDTGHRTTTAKLYDRGEPPVKILKNIETVANMYAGRLVAKGTTDFDIKVADGVLAVPIGWLGYEDTQETFKPATIDTIYVVSDKAVVLRGGGFSIRAAMPRYFYATQGDVMLSWIDGQVVPGELINGQPFIKVPFTKANGETNTNIDFATGMVVSDFKLLVNSAGASYVDAGILSSEGGGDANGFLDGVVTTATGLIDWGVTWTAATNNYIKQAGDVTLGALLADLKYGTDAAADEDGTFIRKSWKCDGTAISLVYDTNNVATSGYLLIGMQNPGIRVVGYAEETVDAAAAVKYIWVRSTL